MMWDYYNSRTGENPNDFFVNNGQHYGCNKNNPKFYSSNWEKVKTADSIKYKDTYIDPITKVANVPLSHQDALSILKEELQKGNPIIIGAKTSSNSPHFVLVVGYKNSGQSINDFTIIDPWWGENTASSLEPFLKKYNYGYGADIINGSGPINTTWLIIKK